MFALIEYYCRINEKIAPKVNFERDRAEQERRALALVQRADIKFAEFCGILARSES